MSTDRQPNTRHDAQVERRSNANTTSSMSVDREQEKIVRLYNDMGLTPQQIVERARENTPQLSITESLVNKIMCSPPRR